MCILNVHSNEKKKKKKNTSTLFQSDFVCFQIQFEQSIKDRPHHHRSVHRWFSIDFLKKLKQNHGFIKKNEWSLNFYTKKVNFEWDS